MVLQHLFSVVIFDCILPCIKYTDYLHLLCLKSNSVKQIWGSNFVATRLLKCKLIYLYLLLNVYNAESIKVKHNILDNLKCNTSPSETAVSFTLSIFVTIKKFHFYSMNKAPGGLQQIKSPVLPCKHFKVFGSSLNWFQKPISNQGSDFRRGLWWD